MSANNLLPSNHGSCKGGQKSSLRVARLVAGLSQEDLARELGRDRSWVSRVEIGEIYLSPTEQAQFSTVLGIPANVLFPTEQDDEA